jgi:SAM-dependent methyltransferase
MERTLRRQCAICGGVSFTPYHSVHRSEETFSIVTCDCCGHIFVADPPADTANHIDINKIDWAFRPRHNQIRRLILSRLKPGQRVLEIGCGRGEVGFLMGKDPVQYQGYEPARGLSDFGIRAGVPIVQQVYKGGARADAIIIDNVLEHVAEPLELIALAAGSLNAGGMMVVITPNVHDIRAISRKWRDRHLWVPPDHINFFSANDIEFIFRSVGLKPQRFKFSPLRMSDYRFFPRAAAETLGLSIFGHNVYALGSS